MRRLGCLAALALALATVGAAKEAVAQGLFAPTPPSRRPVPTSPVPVPAVVAPPVAPASTDLRGRFGVEKAIRLIRSIEPDDKLRGLARAAAVGTPEALALLVQSLEPQGAARSDARATIAVARGLSGFVDQPSARSALAAIVSALPPAPRPAASGRLELDDSEQAPRLQLAREIAALALAGSGDPRAVELLIPIARGSGPGQSAAARALCTFPPTQAASLTAGTLTQGAPLELYGALGDLRTIDMVRAATHASDPSTRAEALIALGELGDARGVELARAAMGEHDPRVRAAGAETLVALEALEKFKAVEALLADDATALAGARLAERAGNAGVVKALAARAVSSQWEAVRAAATAALGRSAAPDAVRTLVELLKYPLLQGDAANALGRSPSEAAMPAIEATVLGPIGLRRLGVRAYVVRALVRRERSNPIRRAIEGMASSADGPTRSLGVGSLIALGDLDLAAGLADPDPRVRRAAATASLASWGAGVWHTLLAARAAEKDELTREVLGLGLLGGDPEGLVTTTTLIDRAEAGGADAPLSAMALARRTDAAHDAKVNALLGSRDPVMRAHTARGLGESGAQDTAGRLAAAYAYEPNANVRRAIILALAARSEKDARSPSFRTTIDVAARLDPDPQVRWVAARAALGQPFPLRAGPSEVAWMRLMLPAGEPPPSGMIGALVRSDGLAVPIAFDEDGYALVPGTPPGESRLVLAPRPPAYEASSP